MTICPWCGTNYPSFQSNCRKCGGPLQMARENAASPTSMEEITAPPPAPRLISGRYTWRLLLTDGWGIVALVFGLLGVTFSLIGAGLAFVIVTASVGIPFLLIGLVFLVVALAVGTWRYNRARQVVNVLRIGESTQGQIIDVQKDYSVRVNRQHPWVIRYQFQVNGQDYEGNVRTLSPVGARLQTGKTVWILYVPNAPQWNSIYPHP
jgi:hypothetical protein